MCPERGLYATKKRPIIIFIWHIVIYDTILCMYEPLKYILLLVAFINKYKALRICCEPYVIELFLVAYRRVPVTKINAARPMAKITRAAHYYIKSMQVENKILPRAEKLCEEIFM